MLIGCTRNVNRSHDFTVRIDSIALQDSTVLAYKINTLEITTKNGLTLDFRDSVSTYSQLPARYVVDSVSGDLYFNKFSYSINRMSTEDGTIIASLEMPALILSGKRHPSDPNFRIHKNYLFFSTGNDVLIMSKTLDLPIALGDELQKDNGARYFSAPVHKISYAIRNDTLLIRTIVVYDNPGMEQDVQVVNHAIYLPDDPHRLDLSDYRIRGKSRQNVPMVLPEQN